jgi:hypothetical protein
MNTATVVATAPTSFPEVPPLFLAISALLVIVAS